MHSLEPPDVTGSSLTLGTAGSRRTVYLIDENSKLPDTTTPNSETDISSKNNNNNNGNNSTPATNDQSPSTFLMYNRISNVIGDTGAGVSGSNNNENAANNSDALVSSTVSDKNAKERKKAEEREKAIWYEYGCV